METKLKVLNTDVRFYQSAEEEYISLTDIARYKDHKRGDYIIQNWLKNRNTLEFVGIWEQIHHKDFNSIEFDGIRKKAGLNSFVITPKQWIEKTNARGIISKAGRYGGTYAHRDIAFEFASWISVEFKLYLIQEFQRLKEDENERKALGWNIRRNLAKINYKIHTDAIKTHLICQKYTTGLFDRWTKSTMRKSQGGIFLSMIKRRRGERSEHAAGLLTGGPRRRLTPPTISRNEENLIYATEADLLNLALFGMTAKEWREKNPHLEGNIRDYSDVSQLVCLSNLENLNALFIKEGLDKSKRLEKLNTIAIEQMTILTKERLKKLTC